MTESGIDIIGDMTLIEKPYLRPPTSTFHAFFPPELRGW